MNESKTSLMLNFIYKTLCEASKVYSGFGVKGCQYIAIQSNEHQISLLIGFGYQKTYNQGTL